MKLTLKNTPPLRVDLRALSPAIGKALTQREVERLPLTHGSQTLPLAEFFEVTFNDDDTWRIEGDLSRFDRIGWQMAAGHLVVDGPVGDYAGAGMHGGALHVKGSAGALAACEMAGGLLEIDGDVGDFAASTLPGSMDGMRGGSLIVRGHAGARFGDRMRRGTALVFGDAGDFLASRMVAGSIAVGGRVGAHLGYGMRRGSVVLAGGAGGAGGAGAAPQMPATFMPALVDPVVFWQLLSRDLARHGGPFESLPARRITRHLGDVSAAGKGELIVVS
ncbi:MAG TPA: formylmethanofuran dehydrogenase subunit C [Ideonella sp.]|nr:formylmethanofuran dehydrogenase subunit C [Ideonella sp.]